MSSIVDAKQVVSGHRRGLGAVFLCSGAAYATIMAFATAHALGVYALDIPADRWGRVYSTHFSLTLAAGAIHLWRRYSRGDGAMLQLVIDFLLGLVLFAWLERVVARGLLGGTLPAWLSLLPAAFLLFYGYRLRQGRQLWSRLDLI